MASENQEQVKAPSSDTGNSEGPSNGAGPRDQASLAAPAIPVDSPSPSSLQAAQQVNNESQRYLNTPQPPNPIFPPMPIMQSPHLLAPVLSPAFLAAVGNYAALLNLASNSAQSSPTAPSHNGQHLTQLLQLLQQNTSGSPQRASPQFQQPMPSISYPLTPQKPGVQNISTQTPVSKAGKPVDVPPPPSITSSKPTPKLRTTSHVDAAATPSKKQREERSVPVNAPLSKHIRRNIAGFRPRSSIPSELTLKQYAEQCKHAAISSRLSADTLHPKEYLLMRKHITPHQATVYLNIRNGILRLWQKNPLVAVSREEACGCAKDFRHFELANIAFDWLVRNGYINFGCIEMPSTISKRVEGGEPSKKKQKRKQKTIAIIGAGMSGLGCARQLEGLISQLGELMEPGDEPPKIIVLEARNRIGGRVYSHPVKDQSASALGPENRATVDLGASIITGFDNGNPLSVVVRGQLALKYHILTDNLVLHDTDGKRVDENRDYLVEKLYNDVLDRAAVFRQRNPIPHTVTGDKELIEIGRDPPYEGTRTIAEVEGTEKPPGPHIILNPMVAPYSASVNKLTGKPANATGSSAEIPAGEQIQRLGWDLKPDVPSDKPIELKSQNLETKNGQFPSLGKTMDYILEQYQELVDLTPLDLRLANWHYANLEYANAVNVEKLSLGHWDQDDGNEFRGPHTMLTGGYTQVPRGLWLAPKKLDVRFNSPVKKIKYGGLGVKIECENDTQYDVDHVVISLPLGVLKAGAVEFEPALPKWKTGAIERLGFGLLNKVVLVYKEAFWEMDRDMAGFLREPDGDELKQSSYISRRGRFYMFWNTTKVSGVPTLVALMAGDAAEQTETEPDESLIKEATDALSKMYPDSKILEPAEAMVTRWRSDPYARGTYSYIAPEATGEDYNLMAAPVDNKLFFAGEASCQTHPATVHGAYISGLRAASEVAEVLFGPIHIPTPLVPPKIKTSPPASQAPAQSQATSTPQKRKPAPESAAGQARDMQDKRLEEYEAALAEALKAEFGERPQKPGRTGANPFLLYQKDKWFICKAKCDEEKQKSTGNPEAKASRNEVRAALGLMWREAPADEKKPYLSETEGNKTRNNEAANDYKKAAAEWDKKAEKFKKEWRAKNPTIPTKEEEDLVKVAEEEAVEAKRQKLSEDGSQVEGTAVDGADS